jgi:hypothetical protein
LYATPALGFSDNRYYEFKRLDQGAADRARVGTEATQAARAGRLEPGG